MDINCPIDGLALGKLEPRRKVMTRPEKEIEPGSHMHWDMDVTLTCPNGHAFRVSSGFIIERVK